MTSVRPVLEHLGPEVTRAAVRAMAVLGVAAAAQGAAYALLLPVVRHLLDAPTRVPVAPLAWLVGAWVAAAVLQATGTVLARSSGYALPRPLHTAIGDHLARVPAARLDDATAGRVGRVTGPDVMQVVTVPAHLAEPLVTATVTPLAAIGVMVWIDPPTALVALLLLPALALAHVVTGRLVLRNDTRVHEAAAEASSRVMEFARMQVLLRSRGVASSEANEVSRSLRSLHDAQGSLIRWAVPALGGFSLAVQVALTVLVVALALRGSHVDAASLVVLAVLIARTVEPVLVAAELGAATRLATAGARRVGDLLTEPVMTEPDRPAPAPQGPPSIRFDEVSAGYGDDLVLDRVSFIAPAGRVTALVGASGSGKSTAVRLAARLMDPTSGHVSIGESTTRELGSTGVASLVAPVFQDCHLFDGSLRSNILAGRPDCTPEQLAHAVECSGVGEIAARLPAGLDAPVGEGGGLLSGGERQRVALARAVLKEAPIIVLDEPTSALDGRTEHEVLEGLSRVFRDRTVLVVTHHTTLLERADHVVALSRGRVHHDPQSPRPQE